MQIGTSSLVTVWSFLHNGCKTCDVILTKLQSGNKCPRIINSVFHGACSTIRLKLFCWPLKSFSLIVIWLPISLILCRFKLSASWGKSNFRSEREIWTGIVSFLSRLLLGKSWEVDARKDIIFNLFLRFEIFKETNTLFTRLVWPHYNMQHQLWFYKILWTFKLTYIEENISLTGVF